MEKKAVSCLIIILFCAAMSLAAYCSTDKETEVSQIEDTEQEVLSTEMIFDTESMEQEVPAVITTESTEQESEIIANIEEGTQDQSEVEQPEVVNIQSSDDVVVQPEEDNMKKEYYVDENGNRYRYGQMYVADVLGYKEGVRVQLDSYCGSPNGQFDAELIAKLTDICNQCYDGKISQEQAQQMMFELCPPGVYSAVYTQPEYFNAFVFVTDIYTPSVERAIEYMGREKMCFYYTDLYTLGEVNELGALIYYFRTSQITYPSY